VLGSFTEMAGVSIKHVAVFHNGTFSEVAGGIYGYGSAAASFDGKLYIGGRYTTGGSLPARSIATVGNGVWSVVGMGNGAHNGWESDLVDAIVTNDRYVFIGGNFTKIAALTTNHVAAWDKTTKQWTTLGSGVDGNVYALALAGDNLIVSGYFGYCGTTRAQHIATYNITTHVWAAMGAGARRSVDAIASDGTNVYAATYFPNEGGNFHDYIGRWDGTNWSIDGGPLVGFVNALAIRGSTLYAAGQLDSADGIAVNNIAQLQSGLWDALGNGLTAANYAPRVDALAVSGSSLYAAGAFNSADGSNAPGAAVWDGTSWSSLSSGLDYAAYALTTDGIGGAYFGGDFQTAGGITLNHLTHWNATASSFEDVNGGVDNRVVALATDLTALYAGGWMETAGSSNVPSLHFASLKGSGAGVSTSPPANNTMESVYPNPVVSASTVDISLTQSGPIKLELFNSLGERASLIADAHFDSGPHQFPLDAHDLPSGLYFLRLSTGENTVNQQLVIQH